MSGSERFQWMHHHNLYSESAESLVAGTGGPLRTDDPDLIVRALRAFRSTNPERFYGADSQWRNIFEAKQGAIFAALMTGPLESAAEILHNPHRNFLYYGFEDLHAGSFESYQNGDQRAAYAMRCRDLLVRLAEALGVLRVENPEGGSWGVNITLPLEDLVLRIEESAGATLPLPDLHPGYYGLRVRDGFITDRLLNAYYCAFRVKQLLASRASSRIIEIGGGMGYVAYYAALMGCRNFTIIDLPLTNLCQGYFLMRSLGPQKIALHGEDAGQSENAVVHVLTPAALREMPACDLVVNIDGLTEYGAATASDYLTAIKELTPRMLSINHEANPYRVFDLAKQFNIKSYQRYPYWLRNGYVEELIEF